MDLYVDKATVFIRVCTRTITPTVEFKFTLKRERLLGIYIMNRVIQSAPCLFNLKKNQLPYIRF